HAHGQLLRQARSEAVPDRAERFRPRRSRSLHRRLQVCGPRVGGEPRARRSARAAPVPSSPPGARAPARLGGPPAADPRGGRPRTGRPLRQGFRVPRGGAADPGRGPAGRCGRGTDRGVRRRCRRAAGRRSRHPRGARGPRAPPPGRRAERDAALHRASRSPRPARTGRRARRAAAGPGRVRTTRFFFLATVFAVTFEKVHWALAGSVSLADILAIGFLVAYLFERLGRRDGRLPQTALIVLGFLLSFLLVYLIGYFNLDTSEAVAQFGKGMVKFVIHFLFLFFGVAYLAQRSQRFYWQTLGFFAAGMVVNAAYGVLQLLAARSGSNLDNAVLGPITGGQSAINIYGAVGGKNVYRPNALTGDPNHLGIMLIMPLLVLTPLYLRLERD